MGAQRPLEHRRVTVWAAEALLEYLKENQEICTRRKRPTSPPPLPSWRMDYESIASGERAARSVFDVYLREKHGGPTSSRRAARRMCKRSFFLHVVPEDLEDLPADRRQYGFGGANFRYGNNAALVFGGQCIAERTLPDYPIARIRTGQFTPEGDQIWMAEFPVGAGGRRTVAVHCCPIALRRVRVDFSGGSISSNGGALLLREVDRKLGLTERGGAGAR